ncbi:MAG: formyltransferase family protein [Patescibacteria group bacterium]
MEILKVAVMFSGGASALKYLFDNDSNYHKTYEVVCAITNKKDTNGERFCLKYGIPVHEINTKMFCIGKGYTGPINKMPANIRQDYFTHMYKFLRKNYSPDLILLSGFMLEITNPLLLFCPIINVHPADLRILDEETGKPKYRGDNAVTTALHNGEKTTVSTIHVVTNELDCGRIICVSDPINVVPECSPSDHQEKMKIECDGPAYVKALQMITSGEYLLTM